MRVLIPKEITPAMIAAGTSVPEVDAARGEVAWDDTSTYSDGDLRNYGGSIWEAVTSVPAGVVPGSDGTKWLRKGPSNRMAPFDEYLYTKAVGVGSVTYVLNPPFITGLALHGLDADEVFLEYRDSANEVKYSETAPLWEQAFGLFEYLFGDLQRTNKWTANDLPLLPDGTLTLTLSKLDAEHECSVGWVGIGQWKVLHAPGKDISGTQYGVEVTPKSYSYFKRSDIDGTYVRMPGRTAKAIQGTVVIAADKAPQAEEMLRQVLDVPVAVDFSELPRYRHLSTVGFLTGSVAADSYQLATVKFKIEGNV